LCSGICFTLHFILVVIKPAISHGYTGGHTPIGIFQEMVTGKATGTDLGDFKCPVSLSTSLKLLMHPKNADT
jgi:hypothetical protein